MFNFWFVIFWALNFTFLAAAPAADPYRGWLLTWSCVCFVLNVLIICRRRGCLKWPRRPFKWFQR